MGNLFVTVSDEVNRKIRILALDKYGSRNGSLSKIVEDALKFYSPKIL